MSSLKFENTSEQLKLQTLVCECLPIVEAEGWNALKPTVVTTQGLLGQFFPGGVEEIFLLHQDFLNQKVVERINDSDAPVIGTTAKIVCGIQTRLLTNSVKIVKQTHRFFIHPFYGHLAGKCLYRFVNTLWYAAGDSATDFNFYTKRATLGAVFTATELYWLQDNSPGYYKTWNFLDTLLQGVYQISKIKRIFPLTFIKSMIFR